MAQTVNAAWTAEERDSVRSIAHNLQVSWKKESTLGNRTFTIGVSTIGGNDVIGANPGAIGSPGNYKYFDETDYVTSLSWERKLDLPAGGLGIAMAEASLDNTSNRFTPNTMRGNSELYTAILPRRPIIISAGFNFDGIDQTIPQFSGILDKIPLVDSRSKTTHISGADYSYFFKDRFLDQSAIFTGVTTDQVYQTLLQNIGLSTAQYDLDAGLNTIPFAIFEKGTKYLDVFHNLAEAENGQFYQDESGIFRFENRQHWYSSPYTNVQRVITTAQVLEAGLPIDTHLVNVVEISSSIYEKQGTQIVFTLQAPSSILVAANSTITQFFEFQDPVLELINPTNGGTDSYYKAFSVQDESGTDLTSSISISNKGTFAQAVKYHITNTSGTDAYITQFVLSGRVAKKTKNLYYRETLGSSITAYEENVFTLNNEYIQNESWAASFAQLLFRDFSSPENLQVLTIRAIPELQLGDLVSWQGLSWRIYSIKSKLDPSNGFIQELTMLKREVQQYFTIGISTIGGTHQIAA